MPPKDDDDPKTTKEVVTKKHKQMLNREELDLSLVAEAFNGLLMEAPAKKGSGKGSDLPFKEPEPEKPKSGAQSGGRSKGEGPRTTRPRSSKPQQPAPAEPPSEKYPKSDPRKALINYATEVETRGVAGGRRTPEQVGLSSDEVAKRTRLVRDTFAAADRGDKKASDKVKEYQRGYDKKYGEEDGRTGPRRTRERTFRTGRTVRTRSSADPGLRDMQGRKGQAPLDPELQKAASRRAGQVPDEPTVGGESKPPKGASRRARARGQAQAQGAGRPGRGSTGRSGGQILRDLIGKEAEIERIKADIEKRDAQTAANRKRGAAKAKQTVQRKATAAAIRAQDTARVRSTPKPGGPLGGYKPTPTSTPANVARQMKVDPRAITRTRALTTPSAQPRGASGGDAGAAVRKAMQQRAAAAKPPAVKPSIPRRVGGTLARGAFGTGISLGLGAGIEKLPIDRQTKDRLQTATAVGAAALTPVTSTLLSIGGSTPQGETTKPSASDTVTTHKSDPNKVTVRSAKPTYDPRNPYDITKWRFRLGNDPGVTTMMTKTELDKLTKRKFPDLRGSVVPGSIVPKGFVSTDPELAAQTKRERQLSTGTEPQTQTAAPPAAAPPKVKVDTKVDEPKEDPKPKPTPKTIPGVKIGPGGFQITQTKPTRRDDKKGRFRLPGLGFPQQPGGKIGRRANPQ